MRYLRPGILALAMGLAACSPSPRLSDKDYAKEALARFETEGGHPGTRVLSLIGNGVLKEACGWVDLGAPDGIALLVVSGRSGKPQASVDLYSPGVGDPTQRITQTFYSQLARQGCADSKILPPAPAGFAVSAASAAELDRLWQDNGPKWAIIQPPGQADFVGLRRRTGGGVIITPAFASRAEAQGWIDREGDALAEIERAKGKAAMAKFDECLGQARGDARDRCPTEGMDQVVQLHAAARPTA